VDNLLSASTGLMYALRVLRSHGIPPASLHDVFRPTVVSKITYCSPAWSDMCPSIQLGADTVRASDYVLLLGVIISADLSLDRHVSVVSSASFYWLRQLRRVRRSLDDESAAILVHAFVTSRVDYCNLLLARPPKSVTDKLQRVMNAAARIVSGTKKYDHGLTHLFNSELHWLDVADRVTYKLGVTVYKCLHGQAPDYLSELCTPTPVAQVAERQHLRSAIRHLLVVPQFQLDTYGRRTFAVAGPTTRTRSKTICVSRTWKLTVFVVH